jgi:DNA-binding transcriptional MocR family regulator
VATAWAAAIRTAVRDGRLAVGTRLPSTRALAVDLGVARGTVTKAYAEGYLRSRQGGPTVVAALSRRTQPSPTLGGRAHGGRWFEPLQMPPLNLPFINLETAGDWQSCETNCLLTLTTNTAAGAG